MNRSKYTVRKKESVQKQKRYFLPGHFPLSLLTFPLTLQHNAMRIIKETPLKNSYGKFLYINTINNSLFLVYP